MIDNPSGYQFVNGITGGEVIINGHIMPWRDYNYVEGDLPPTDKPECLRGEDPCFLYEAIARLYYLQQGYTESIWTYSPRIIRNFMYLRAGFMRSFYDETWYGDEMFCVRDDFPATLTYTPTDQSSVTKADFSDAFPDYRSTTAIRASDPTDFQGYGINTPLRGDNIRKLFYDLHRLKCMVVNSQRMTLVNVTSNHVDEREMGRTEADWNYEGNKVYPYWGSTGSNWYSIYVLGESIYHTQRAWGSEGTIYLERARSWEASSTGYIDVTFPSDIAFGRYATCTNALLLFSFSGDTTFYSKPTVRRFSLVPATTLSESSVRV